MSERVREDVCVCVFLQLKVKVGIAYKDAQEETKVVTVILPTSSFSYYSI